MTQEVEGVGLSKSMSKRTSLSEEKSGLTITFLMMFDDGVAIMQWRRQPF